MPILENVVCLGAKENKENGDIYRDEDGVAVVVERRVRRNVNICRDDVSELNSYVIDGCRDGSCADRA